MLKNLPIIILTALIMSIQCGNNEKSKTEDNSSIITKRAQEERDEALANYQKESELVKQKAFEKIIKDFSDELKASLMAALKERGPSGAIEVCSNVAPALAVEYSRSYWDVKRVTNHSRNKDNQATDNELMIMNKFTDNPDLAFYHEQKKTEKGMTDFYYKPIRMAAPCLNCHGSDEDISPDVRATLNDLYPEDKATGYKAGDLRGMFVVSGLSENIIENARTVLRDSL